MENKLKSFLMRVADLYVRFVHGGRQNGACGRQFMVFIYC